ncbi:MAG: WbuC family cupin fold metalloprotein [Candidatus Omnitrophota bacterium]
MIKINNKLIEQAAREAKASPRKRINYNFHKDYNEGIQRILNAADTQTYVRPHKHEAVDKTEIFIILKGRVLCVEFDDTGKIIDHLFLDAQKGNFGVEIKPGIWHSFISLKNGSCVYEIKQGPYDPKSDKRFASWSPAEDETGEGRRFNRKIISQLKSKPR